MSNCKTKTFIRWAGSKKRLLPNLIRYWQPSFSRYIEPFMGSACLFFAIKPYKAILNDINLELVNTFNTIKNNAYQVYKKLLEVPINKDQYYSLRSLDPKNLDKIDRSVRFLYLNRHCFNGLYRTNKSGQFNVPYSGYRTGNYPDYEIFSECSILLKNAIIFNLDFQKIIETNICVNDFVYFDPPYAISNSRKFIQYDANSFGLKDIERLKHTIDLIISSDAYFLLSYAKCDEILDLFHNYLKEEIEINRFISGFSQNRNKSKELIFSNIDL